MGAAVSEAIDGEMQRDPTIFIAGEDVRIGGPFGTEAGIYQKYGEKRVIDTPISEQAIVGLGIGAATVGLRPIIEIMIMDFVGIAMDQLVNQMAKMKYMLGGNVTLPILVTTHAGIDSGSGAQHSQQLEAWFCHVPGLKVIMPSTAADAKGLVTSAIREDNPVICIYNKRCLMTSCEVPDEPYTIPLGVADIKRARDPTSQSSPRDSWCTTRSRRRKTWLRKGIEAEVIDPRTLSPLDIDPVLESVRKTGRIVVAQEAVDNCGLGAEIAARVQDQAFDYLDAPVKRVGAPFSPVPYSPPLEKLYLPGKQEILAAVRAIL